MYVIKNVVTGRYATVIYSDGRITWTVNAFYASHFDTKDEAETFIDLNGLQNCIARRKSR